MPSKCEISAERLFNCANHRHNPSWVNGSIRCAASKGSSLMEQVAVFTLCRLCPLQHSFSHLKEGKLVLREVKSLLLSLTPHQPEGREHCREQADQPRRQWAWAVCSCQLGGERLHQSLLLLGPGSQSPLDANDSLSPGTTFRNNWNARGQGPRRDFPVKTGENRKNTFTFLFLLSPHLAFLQTGKFRAWENCI